MDLMDSRLTHKCRSCDNFVLFIHMYFVSTVKEDNVHNINIHYSLQAINMYP